LLTFQLIGVLFYLCRSYLIPKENYLSIYIYIYCFFLLNPHLILKQMFESVNTQDINPYRHRHKRQPEFLIHILQEAHIFPILSQLLWSTSSNFIIFRPSLVVENASIIFLKCYPFIVTFKSLHWISQFSKLIHIVWCIVVCRDIKKASHSFHRPFNIY